jgi:hypothetical protein
MKLSLKAAATICLVLGSSILTSLLFSHPASAEKSKADIFKEGCASGGGFWIEDASNNTIGCNSSGGTMIRCKPDMSQCWIISRQFPAPRRVDPADKMKKPGDFMVR